MGPGRDILQVLENKEKFDKIQLNTVSKHWKFFSVLLYVRDYIFVIFIIGKDTG